MSLFLMLFLTLICLACGHYPAPWAAFSLLQSALLTIVGVALIGLHAFWVSRRFCWPLDRDPLLRLENLNSYDRWRFIHQIVLFGVYGIILVVFGWGWWIQQGGPREESGKPMGMHAAELLLLAPFFIAQALSWWFFYDADRAAHHAAYRLHHNIDPFGQTWLESQQRAVPPFGGRLSYVLFQMRQKLALVLIPVILLIVYQEISRFSPRIWDHWLMSVLIYVTLGIVFVGMPFILRLALGLKSMPSGELRTRLEEAAKRLGLTYSDFLVWNTRSGMANAMVVGLVPWLRYVVFTDRLISEFSGEEMEAVLGHEAGHVHHRHILYYLVFLILSMVALLLLTNAYLPMLMQQFGELLSESTRLWLSALLVVIGLLGYLFVVFGFLSRRCERQSDVYGCRAVSCADVACCGHDEQTKLVPRGKALCPTGIHTFIRALDRVAEVNGISRTRPGFLQSWQHSTIARRIEFLRQIQAYPQEEARFQRSLLCMQVLFLVVLILLCVFYWQPLLLL